MRLKTNMVVQFDRSVLRRKWKRINRSPMARAGLLVRKIARQSIRRRSSARPKHKRRPSMPGTPPRSWDPAGPMKMIFSAPLSGMDVAQIVGAVGFGGMTPVPELMEHGGTAPRVIREEKTEFLHKNTRKTSGKYAAKKTTKSRQRRTVRYTPRPFMEPALRKARTKLPALWRNSIKEG